MLFPSRREKASLEAGGGQNKVVSSCCCELSRMGGCDEAASWLPVATDWCLLALPTHRSMCARDPSRRQGQRRAQSRTGKAVVRPECQGHPPVADVGAASVNSGEMRGPIAIFFRPLRSTRRMKRIQAVTHRHLVPFARTVSRGGGRYNASCHLDAHPTPSRPSDLR